MNKWDESGLFPWEDDVPATPATPEVADAGAVAAQDDGDLSRASAATPERDTDTIVDQGEPVSNTALPAESPSAETDLAVGQPVRADPPARAEQPVRAELASAEQPVRAEPASAEPPVRAEPPAQTRPLVRKEYYAISEVSDLVGLPAHVLRYWESQFSVLNPSKNRSGNRVYQRKEIKLILLVKQLLHEEKYTVEGAKQKLDRLRRGGDMAEATRHALDEQMVRVLREDLTALGELLKMDAE